MKQSFRSGLSLCLIINVWSLKISLVTSQCFAELVWLNTIMKNHTFVTELFVKDRLPPGAKRPILWSDPVSTSSVWAGSVSGRSLLCPSYRSAVSCCCCCSFPFCHKNLISSWGSVAVAPQQDLFVVLVLNAALGRKMPSHLSGHSRSETVARRVPKGTRTVGPECLQTSQTNSILSCCSRIVQLYIIMSYLTDRKSNTF